VCVVISVIIWSLFDFVYKYQPSDWLERLGFCTSLEIDWQIISKIAHSVSSSTLDPTLSVCLSTLIWITLISVLYVFLWYNTA